MGVMRREDGAVVARFTHNDIDPEKVRRAAEEDRQGTLEARRKDPHIYIHQTSQEVCFQRSLHGMIVEFFRTRR